MTIKPLTVSTGTHGEVTPLQREGLDRVADYLVNALHSSVLLPLTGRIVIEWGDEEALEELRTC